MPKNGTKITPRTFSLPGSRSILFQLVAWITLTTVTVPAVQGEEDAAAADDPTQIRLAGLIEDLGGTTYARRQAAEAEIADLGRAGKQKLEIAVRNEDPELRSRAGRLLKRLKIEELWDGSPVSLVTDEVKASEVVRVIAEQTGNDLSIGDQYGTFNDVTTSLQHPGSLFWQVVDDLCRKSDNRVRGRLGTGRSGLVFVSGNIGQSPVAYSGPIRAQLVSAKRVFVENFDYEDLSSKTTHTYQFNLSMSWEQKFRLVAHQSHLTVAAAAAEEPIHLVDHRPAENGWQVVNKESRQYTTALRIQPPPRAAQQLRRLTLRWDLIAVGDMDDLTIDDPQPSQVYRKGDLGMVVNEIVKTTGTRWELTVAVSRDLVVPDPEEVLFVENQFELYDQQQRRFTVQGTGRLGITRGAARMKLAFVAPTADSVPSRLVIRFPRIRDRRELAITFHDVPLPTAMPD